MAAALNDSVLFDYKVEKSAKSDSVLCTLSGYLTFHDTPNRNNRRYPKPFWKEQCDSPRIQEQLATKTLFGEAKHPGADSLTPDVEAPNISHCVRSIKVDDTGVFGVIDVLNTTNGRVIKTLVDYGSKIAVSTRAFGKQIADSEGYYVPDSENYLLVTWDFVTFPAFSEARPAPSHDSVDIDDPVYTFTKDKLLADMKNMLPQDAMALCDAVGINYEAPVDPEVLELRQQLDSLMQKVVALEDRDGSVVAALPVPVKSPHVDVSDVAQSCTQILEVLTDKTNTRKKLLEGLKDQAQILSDRDAALELNASLLQANQQLRDEVESLRKANLTLIEDKQQIADAHSALSKHFTEVENLAERVIEDYEEMMESSRVLESQLDQAELQIRDLAAIRTEPKSSTRVRKQETTVLHDSASARPMCEHLVDVATNTEHDNLGRLVKTLKKGRTR